MDIRDVINRAELPPEDNHSEVFAYQADKLVASVVSQTYDYMARCGLQYGYITTGEADVFLKVDWNESAVVYFHLAEPAFEAAVQPPETAPYCTAISQVLAFCLLAMQTEPSPQGERNAVLHQLAEWAVDWENILGQIHTSSPDHQSSSSPFEEPVDYAGVDRSPRVTRQRARRCEPEDSSHEEGPSRSRSPDSPSPISRREQSKRNRSEITSSSSQQPQRNKLLATSQLREHQFCTHHCIQSLMRGDVPDENCPNFEQHFPGVLKDHEERQHPFSGAGLMEAIRRQQSQTLDQGCKPIDRGSHSVVFKITLLTHGYMLIGKGTVDNLQQFLADELRAYEWVSPLQRIRVPVCLGLIPMPRTYNFNLNQITHMLLMTWAGRRTNPKEGEQVNLRKILRSCGVVRLDEHERNFLRCPYSGELVAIDFEGSNSRSRSRQLYTV